MEERIADRIWNRAALHQNEGALEIGDRALMALLRAHGLIMNGGVLNSVEVMTREEFDRALWGYRFFRLSEITELLTRAIALVRGEGAEIGPHEQWFDAEYERIIPQDSFLFAIFEKHLQDKPADFTPTA